MLMKLIFEIIIKYEVQTCFSPSETGVQGKYKTGV